ncbi:hypothetical protein V5O48_007698 [Marasmius crinis-equi]|uniref:Uncharacterized protein n=1 Tax=Marasmius crinis-equi TaxID=585013 RepID=A0ABR3FG04_9AGAR
MSVSNLSRDNQGETLEVTFVTVRQGTKRKLVSKEPSYKAFERVVKTKFAIEETTEIVIKTKDYDPRENELFEIDDDVFARVIPSLRSVELSVVGQKSTSASRNDHRVHDNFEKPAEPCIAVQLRTHEIPMDAETSKKYKTTALTSDTATKHPEDTTKNADDRITVKVIKPTNDSTDVWLKMKPAISMDFVMEKIRQKYEKEGVRM